MDEALTGLLGNIDITLNIYHLHLLVDKWRPGGQR